MTRWLCTGGAGFIGTHLVMALLDRGDRVDIVDDFSDAPYPAREKERNWADLEARYAERVRLERACITDRARMEPLVERADAIIHLAGLAGVRPSFRDPARYQRVNVEGTANLVQLAVEKKISRFSFASSSSVYGDDTPLPAKEDAPAILPRSPYAASKRSAELVASAIALARPAMSVTALRFFTVYGPRQRPEMAITTFARACLAEQPIELFGDGSMRRDFTHVTDIVRGIVLAAERDAPGFRAYNLGSGAPVDLLELVRGIERAVGKKLDVRHAPVPLGDVKATFADVSRAKAELGWAPEIRLEDGLRTVVEWVRDHPTIG